MAVPLQIFLGTVNYTNYLHVTAAKVATPSTVDREYWIPVPVTNYTLVIPGLDPDDYYVTFYDAATNSSLGTLISQCFVNAKTNQYAYEVRFYEIGNLPAGATLDATEKIINDPYLLGKTIESYFKEGFRFLEPTVEIDFNNASCDITLLTGGTFTTGEKFTITIQYATGTIAAAGSGGLYTGIINVSAATYTMLAADKNKLVRLVGSASTQVITLPALNTLTVDDGYYFDNSCGGTAVQVKILMNGGDRIRYNGLMEATDEYAEFWVSKGQHLLIKKFDNNYAEIRTDWKGVCVGEQVTVGYKDHPLIISENGQLMDGDQWPLFWYWLTNICPSTHKYTDNTVTGSWTPDITKPGQFAVHGTLKKWRMPKTVGLVQKGLADFETYGTDTANRPVDYPGGYQAEMLLAHGHKVATTGNQSGVDPGRALQRALTNPDPYATGAGGIGPYIEVVGGAQQRVNNVGVIFARRMG